jgi:hypothetical protein
MNSTKPNKLSRREFAQRAALLSAAAPFIPASSALAEQTINPTLAQQPTAPAATSAVPAAQSNEPKLSPEGQKESDARCQSILSSFGDRFNDQERATVRTLCVFLQPSLEHLRAFHMDNGENPALYLKPLVEREKKPLGIPKSPQSAVKPPQSTPKSSNTKS